MKTLLFFIGIFSMCGLQGQKLVKKAFVNSRVQFVQIDSQYCYEVNLDTSKEKYVTVEASIEGEYANDLLVTIEEQGTTVLISAGFQPNFTNPNDKLSAHKVISIKLHIRVPEYKEVSIYGTNSNVIAKGKYKNLKVKLSDGTCRLENVIETVEVNTQKGDIILSAGNGRITAKSVYGRVKEEAIPIGENEYVLSSVQGNIYLKKTK